MKVMILILSMVWLLPAFVSAEPAVTSSNDQECCVYIENIVDANPTSMIRTFLDMEPFSVDDETETKWYFHMVHSDKAQRRLLKAFLPHLQHYHTHSKLPFRAVAEYWDKIFDRAMQIYVFSNKPHQLEMFCASPVCEKLVTTAHMLGLEFIWNGALGIAEEDIKKILGVPTEYTLVTTIFLNQVRSREVSQTAP